MSISHPPTCSSKWTKAERLAYIDWMCDIMLDRLMRDEAGPPVVAKAPLYEYLRAVQLVTSGSTHTLEANRTALEKPYDSSKDRKAFHLQSLN